MASIRQEILIDASPEHVWAAVRDVGNVHRVLVPGYVVDAYMDRDARVVTFANGVVVRELIVDIDDEHRRFVWSAVGGRLTHHNASAEVLAEGQGQSRLVWIADLLPNDMAATISTLMAEGAAVMKRTLDRAA
jgi:carbon monoxide dehydrogenase subunit G